MFCPQCGQQTPDEVRFCPRCGLSLVPHAALLAGYEPAATRVGASAKAPARSWRKRRGARRAAKLMFFSVVLVPIFVGLCFVTEGGEPLLVPFAMFVAGLAWLIYSRLFGDELVEAPELPSREDLTAGGEKRALGAQQSVPPSFLNQRRANTAEIAQPPSVTENTTKLLDKDA